MDRTLRQNAFSLSDNLTWIKGGHTLESAAVSGRATWRATGSVLAPTSAANTGSVALSPATRSPTSCSGCPIDTRDHLTNRGPLDGHSNDVAAFAQDDWKINKSMTVFLGLRYEVVGAWHEKSLTLANFSPADGGHHIVAERGGGGQAAAGPDRSRPYAHG